MKCILILFFTHRLTLCHANHAHKKGGTMKQRPDGRWLKRKSINGRLVSFYSTEKTEARAIKDIERQMLSYVEKTSSAAKFEAVAEEWKEKHIEKITHRTWCGYQAHYKRAVEAFGNCKIGEISTEDVQSYIDDLAELNYAHKTVRAAAQVMSLIMDFAVHPKRYIKKNPCAAVTIPNGLKKGKRELPTENEIEKVKNSVDKHFGLFAYTLLLTGMRRGEALALTDKDIDFKNKMISVNKSVYYVSNQPHIKTPKTDAGTRTIHLLDALAEKLKGKKGYIFGGEKPMTEQAFQRAWERYARESGVTVTPHQLRHAYATLLFDAGIDAKSAQMLLGHSDYKTTMDIYTHISESRKKIDFDKLNSII